MLQSNFIGLLILQHSPLFYAAAVACVQSDIKRVLAFSTISQIGFMLVALGVCLPDAATNAVAHTEEYADVEGLGYMASMFHLFTHAMFKACLFLGAGCIIHAVHSNEKAYMGGLRKYMPITHITFLSLVLLFQVFHLSVDSSQR